MSPVLAKRKAPRLPRLLLCLLVAGAAEAQTRPDPSGIWLTETGVSKVRIARCGSGYCGTIVSTGGTGLDGNNPDPTLRGRSLAGVRIFEAGTPVGDGFEGTLYNPSDGRTYSGRLTPRDASTVEVAGCVLSVICKRQTWRRVN